MCSGENLRSLLPTRNRRGKYSDCRVRILAKTGDILSVSKSAAKFQRIWRRDLKHITLCDGWMALKSERVQSPRGKPGISRGDNQVSGQADPTQAIL